MELTRVLTAFGEGSAPYYEYLQIAPCSSNIGFKRERKIEQKKNGGTCEQTY